MAHTKAVVLMAAERCGKSEEVEQRLETLQKMQDVTSIRSGDVMFYFPQQESLFISKKNENQKSGPTVRPFQVSSSFLVFR